MKSITIFLIALLLTGCAVRHIDPANQNTALCTTAGDPCDWMHTLIDAHKDKRLTFTDICLPGAHDAGMYTTQHCTAFANYGNTQTQYLDMRHMLESGIRIFDLRPWLFDGEYYTHHSTHCDGLGCKGGKFTDILRDTRTFLDQHGEIVVLCISHQCHTSAVDTAFLSLLTSTLGDHIYQYDAESERSHSFINTPLRMIVPPGMNKGKVILLIEGMPSTPENRAKGWFSTDVLKTAGGWSDDNHFDSLRAHQLQRFAAYTGNGTALYELAWQVTQHTPQAVRGAFDPHSPTTIRKGAAHANTQLPGFIDSLISTGTIHPGKIPNIIWDDLADTMVTHQAIKLSELNLK